MKNRLLIALLSAVVAALALGGGQAVADPDSNHGTSGVTNPVVLALIGNDALFSTADLTVLLSSGGMNRTQHYGPYPSTSPDSGTCGNDWADDAFDRHFTVRAEADGTFTVVQQFRQGSFVTRMGPSPGSCDDGPVGTVNAGVTGNMHGYFIISNVVGPQNTSPFCNAATSTNEGCTTTTFIDTHFTPCYFGGSGTCPVTTFFFHFAAGDQGLTEHEWQNASPDRGGNRGDIRSTP